MTTLIAVLRGINVIGNNKLPMKELSALLTGMGLRDVQTYNPERQRGVPQ